MAQLQLHEIAPVVLPPKIARACGLAGSGVNSSDGGDGGRAGPRLLVSPPQLGHRHSKHSGSAASNASIFSASLKRASQTGTIQVHGQGKEGSFSSLLPQAAQPHSRHRGGEPIAFDPFSDTPCYAWLIQDPATSTRTQEYRRDPANLQKFRGWFSTRFPKVIRTLQSLQMLHDRPPPKPVHDEVASFPPAPSPRMPSPVQAEEESDDPTLHESSDVESDLEKEQDGNGSALGLEPLSSAERRRRQLLLQRREAQHRAWRVLFEHARLLSVAPHDQFVAQDVTLARDVFFVLSGHCQLEFQPKFLDFVVQKRNALKPNNGNSGPHSSPAPPSPSSLSHTHTRGGGGGGPASALQTEDVDTWTRRLSLSTLTTADALEAVASTVYPLRVLTSGEYFGVEACAFRFVHHSFSAISLGAWQRNAIGVATSACLHVLVVPFYALQEMRELIFRSLELPSTATRAVEPAQPADGVAFAPRRRGHMSRPPPEPSKPLLARSSAPEVHTTNVVLAGCGFREDDVEFLRHTFLFQSMQRERLQFLATQLRLVHVPRHEYLFTTGQEVLVYIVKSGQLRVFSPEQVKIHAERDGDTDAKSGRLERRRESGTSDRSALPQTTTETRHVELEILQIHDMVGLMEASLLQPSFSNYCLATSADVSVYVVPPVALLSVLAHEPTCASFVVENLLSHHSWYKARKFTALNHHNKRTEFRLSLGAQRKSPIPCSRCGWSGHDSTSSICVRASSPKSAFIDHLLQLRDPTATQVVGPATRSSLGLRSQRVASTLQMRPLPAPPRSGSIAMPAAATPRETDRPRPPLPRNGSFVATTTKASQLPALLDLAALLDTMGNDAATEPPRGDHPKTELEKALARLDTALDMAVVPPLLSSPVRPQAQQHQQRGSPRSSINIREEALRAVARISTAVSSPRTRDALDW